MKVFLFLLLASLNFAQGYYYADAQELPVLNIPDYMSSSAAIAHAANDTITVTYPATVDANDLLILPIKAQNDLEGLTIQTPSGWTSGAQNGTFASGFTLNYAFFWKRAAGTEDGTTFTVHFTSANPISDPDMKAVVHRFDSTITTGTPIEDITANTTYATVGAGNDSTFSSTITTTGGYRLAVCLIIIYDNNNIGVMTDYTEVYDAGTATGYDIEFGVEVQDKATAGDVTGRGCSITASDPNLTYTFAIIPIGG